jgi:hypothetical protein
MTIWALWFPKIHPTTPAADSPPTSVSAAGREQQAAHAPTSPSATRSGFFIIILTSKAGNIPVH